MREMKDSGITSIGTIPASWRVRKFKTLAKLCNGKEISSDEGNIPVFGSGGVFKYTNVPLHSGESLLMGRKGTIDNPMLINGDFWTVDTMFYTSEFYDVVGKFLFYCCRGAINYGLYKSGSVLPSMTQTDINNISLPYTSIEEQKQIVAVLDEKCAQVDALVENVQTQIEKLKTYRQSVITEAVTKGLDLSMPMKDSGVEWFDEINASYSMQTIRSLFRIKKDIIGREPDTVLSITQRGLRVKNVNENEGQMANSYANYQIVCVGDFAMNHMDLLTGGIGVAEIEGVTSPDYRVFVKRNPEICSKYFLYVFETYYRNRIFYAFGQGAANMGRWRLPAQNFNTIRIPVPSIDEQFEIAAYLDEKCTQIDRLITIKQTKIEKLEQYKRSLIYEYVTGKKEVS